MFKFLEDFKGIILYTIILIILCCFWVGLEYVLDGRVVSLHSDTIMCFILSWLVTDKVYGFLFERGDKN